GEFHPSVWTGLVCTLAHFSRLSHSTLSTHTLTVCSPFVFVADCLGIAGIAQGLSQLSLGDLEAKQNGRFASWLALFECFALVCPLTNLDWTCLRHPQTMPSNLQSRRWQRSSWGG